MSLQRSENSDERENDMNSTRRDFLRKSLYAAYTTPVIFALLVENASAAQSWNKGQGNIPDNESWHRFQQQVMQQQQQQEQESTGE